MICVAFNLKDMPRHGDTTFDILWEQYIGVDIAPDFNMGEPRVSTPVRQHLENLTKQLEEQGYTHYCDIDNTKRLIGKLIN